MQKKTIPPFLCRSPSKILSSMYTPRMERVTILIPFLRIAIGTIDMATRLLVQPLRRSNLLAMTLVITRAMLERIPLQFSKTSILNPGRWNTNLPASQAPRAGKTTHLRLRWNLSGGIVWLPVSPHLVWGS